MTTLHAGEIGRFGVAASISSGDDFIPVFQDGVLKVARPNQIAQSGMINPTDNVLPIRLNGAFADSSIRQQNDVTFIDDPCTFLPSEVRLGSTGLRTAGDIIYFASSRTARQFLPVGGFFNNSGTTGFIGIKLAALEVVTSAQQNIDTDEMTLTPGQDFSFVAPGTSGQNHFLKEADIRTNAGGTVRLRFYVGSDDSGDLVLDETYVLNAGDNVIESNSLPFLVDGQSYFLKYTAVTNITIKGLGTGAAFRPYFIPRGWPVTESAFVPTDDNVTADDSSWTSTKIAAEIAAGGGGGGNLTVGLRRTSTTLTASDQYIVFDDLSSNATATLPTVVTVGGGKEYWIENRDSNEIVTIVASGTDTLDGETIIVPGNTAKIVAIDDSSNDSYSIVSLEPSDETKSKLGRDANTVDYTLDATFNLGAETLTGPGRRYNFTGTTSPAYINLPVGNSITSVGKFWLFTNNSPTGVAQTIRGSDTAATTVNGEESYILEAGKSAFVRLTDYNAGQTITTEYEVIALSDLHGAFYSKEEATQTVSFDAAKYADPRDHYENTYTTGEATYTFTTAISSTSSDSNYVSLLRFPDGAKRRITLDNTENVQHSLLAQVDSGTFSGTQTDKMVVLPGEIRDFILTRNSNVVTVEPVGPVIYDFMLNPSDITDNSGPDLPDVPTILASIVSTPSSGNTDSLVMATGVGGLISFTLEGSLNYAGSNGSYGDNTLFTAQPEKNGTVFGLPLENSVHHIGAASFTRPSFTWENQYAGGDRLSVNYTNLSAATVRFTEPAYIFKIILKMA